MPDITDLAAVKVVPPTDLDFAQGAIKQQKEMGATYEQVFSDAAHGEAVRKLQSKRNEEGRKIQKMGFRPASILNLMPFGLNVNGVLHQRLAGAENDQIPACPVGSPYVQKVIREPQWSIRDEGAGMDNVDNYTPVPWLPMELAEDYAIEFLDRMKIGGLVIYEGDHEPNTPGLQKAIKDAREARNRWMLRRVQEADADWADTSGKSKKNITEVHRKCAEVLLHEKILKNQPAWLLATNTVGGETPDACRGCGLVPDAQAVICHKCGYVYKPLEAYMATLIEYGHISMDRLTAEEWQKVNEIKEQRDKARSAGSKAKAQTASK